MPRFDPPDAEWTDEYAWTRYRGPQTYPVPADWVLSIVEADGIGWYRYPGIGEGLESDTDVLDVFKPEYDEYNDARDGEAILLNHLVSEDRHTESVEHELSIDGETIFRRVDPTTEDLYATVAEALSRYLNGQDTDDLAPSTGSLPADLKAEQETERKQAENRSLAGFGGEGA